MPELFDFMEKRGVSVRIERSAFVRVSLEMFSTEAAIELSVLGGGPFVEAAAGL